MNRAKRFMMVLAVAAGLGAVAWGLMPGPVPGDLDRVTRGPLAVVLEEDGMTRVVDRYTITAPVAGFLRRVELDPGDVVRSGQALCVLEPLRAEALDPRARAEGRARVAAARAALSEASEARRAAEAAADYAQARHKRENALYADGVVSRDALDKAETDLRETRARLESARFATNVARHELEAARAALEFAAAPADAPARAVSVASPVDGRVLKVLRTSEGVVARGQALLEVGDPRRLEVQVDVLSEDAVRIAPGTRVDFVRWGGERPLKGLVRVVEPVGETKISALGVEEQRVLVIADIVSPREEWERLGDGYRVEASFMLWEGEDVLRVPAGALFRSGGKWAVFRVEGGFARLAPVEIAHQGALAAEVVSGLDEGDVVVIHPSDTVADGVQIESRQ